jgi:hypothetical protein
MAPPLFSGCQSGSNPAHPLALGLLASLDELACTQALGLQAANANADGGIDTRVAASRVSVVAGFCAF